MTESALGLMGEPLSKMKLFIPPVRPRSVARPRLQTQIDQGLAGKFTLISAPAGSGKSTLLSEWRSTERGQQTPLAWLSLEAADSHPARFWLYLFEALERLQPGLTGDLRLMLAGAPLEQIVRLTVNQLAELEREAVLVLDDYHAITNEEIHRSIALLLDLMPPQFHLVILTRVDPPLPLTRLRVRGELTEIRLADLRFTTAEAALFLQSATGRQLTDAQVALLEQRTEGWIAGLQLAALSLQGPTEIESFVQAFAGSHRYVVDYLIEEVLAHLPEQIQSFLIETSILDRLSGPLCDAVTGGSGSQAILEELERRNLFLVALDDHRQWYRYHHLFAEVLRTRLLRDRPAERTHLHSRASEWYQRAGLMEPAVNHALAAGDHQRAVELVAEAAEQIWHRGQNSILMQWLEALPDSLVRSRADFLFAIAWACMTSARLDQADMMLQLAERLIQESGTDDPNLYGGVLAARAHCARVRTDNGLSVQLTERALAILPATNLNWRAMAFWNRAAIHQWCGEYDEAVARNNDALELFRASGDLYGILRATTWNSEILADAGRLPEATAACETALAQAIAQGGEELPMVALAHLGLGECLYVKGELAEAERHLDQAVQVSRNGGLLDVTFLAYLPLSLVKQAQGDPVAALGYLESAEAVAPGVPWAQKHVLAYRALLLLRQGQVEAALRLLPAVEALAQEESPLQEAVLALGALRLTQGRGSEAVGLLESLGGRSGALRSLRRLALQSVALAAAGELTAARATLVEALELGAPSGNVAAFVEAGPAMGALLAAVLPGLNGTVQVYVERLLQAIGTISGAPGTAAGLAGQGAQQAVVSPAGRVVRPLPVAAATLAEPLSERELEVLGLLAEGASNDEIARRLFITVHTAKKHLANLMGKLEAANRTQVVAKARELGYL